MKRLKKFILLFLSLLLSFVFIMGIVYNSIAKTALSATYFNDFVNKTKLRNTVTDIFIDNLSNDSNLIKQKQNMGIDIAQIISTKVDREWLNNNITTALKTSDSYIIGESSSLPVVNIKPFKDEITKGIIDEAIKRNDFLNKFDIITKQIDLAQRIYKDVVAFEAIKTKIINSLAASSEFKNAGLDKTVIGTLIQTYEDNKAKKISDINRALAQILVDRNINLGFMKDNLDFNQLVSSLGSKDNNPVINLRSLIVMVKSYVPQILVVAIISMILIISLYSFDIFKSLQYISGAMLLSAIISLAISLFIRSSGLVNEIILKIPLKVQQDKAAIIRGDINVFAGDVISKITKDSLIILVIAVVLIFLQIFIAKFSDLVKLNIKLQGLNNPAINMARGIFIIIILGYSLMFITTKVNNLNKSVDNLKASTQAVDISKAFADTTGIGHFTGQYK